MLVLSVAELFSVAELSVLLSFLLSVTEFSTGGVVSPTPPFAELLVQPNSISTDKISAVVFVSFFIIIYPHFFFKLNLSYKVIVSLISECCPLIIDIAVNALSRGATCSSMWHNFNA